MFVCVYTYDYHRLIPFIQYVLMYVHMYTVTVFVHLIICLIIQLTYSQTIVQCDVILNDNGDNDVSVAEGEL